MGRLAVAAAGEVDIFPINYADVDRDTILFRTAEGTKLLELTINGRVAFGRSTATPTLMPGASSSRAMPTP